MVKAAGVDAVIREGGGDGRKRLIADIGLFLCLLNQVGKKRSSKELHGTENCTIILAMKTHRPAKEILISTILPLRGAIAPNEARY